jgi:hypothetical protein
MRHSLRMARSGDPRLYRVADSRRVPVRQRLSSVYPFVDLSGGTRRWDKHYPGDDLV